MNRKDLYTITLVLTSCFFSFVVTAQTGTVVKATADRSRILIGEPVTIVLEADIPENEPIRFFFLDSIPHFEFLQKGKIDTTNTGEGTRLKQLIQLTSFDSGSWVVPPFVLRENIQTDSIAIEVGFTPFDPEQPYHDIKDIIPVQEEEAEKQDWWYYLGGALVLLVILLYFLFRKKKQAPAITVKETIDPYRQAMESLAEVQRQRPDTKTYYAAIVDIFRTYIGATKSINSLQKTTDDLVLQLKAVGLPRDNFDALSKILRLSDYVKFAKYQPAAADDEQLFIVIKATIELLESQQPHVV